MCNNVVLLDGNELWTVGQLVNLGFMDESELEQPINGIDPRDRCLCNIDIQEVLKRSGRIFKGGSFDWVEYDAEGRCYRKDGLMEDPDRPSEEYMIYLVKDPSYPYHKKEEDDA